MDLHSLNHGGIELQNLPRRLEGTEEQRENLVFNILRIAKGDVMALQRDALGQSSPLSGRYTPGQIQDARVRHVLFPSHGFR